MPDAMIKPKYSEKNNAAANKHAQRYRKISDTTADDGIGYSGGYGAHNVDHRNKKAGWSYHGGYRDRHDGRSEAMNVPSPGPGRERRDQTLPKMRVPFVPPKPNEFFTAILIDMLRAVFAQ